MRRWEARDALRWFAGSIAVPSPAPRGDAKMVADWVREWGRQPGPMVDRQEVRAGARNVLVICGPGSPARAYGPDEFVDEQEVVDAMSVDGHIVRDMVEVRS
jgi:acetylornithine deacetylase/succinyl-diaminopimelate desuccinylase-like protein